MNLAVNDAAYFQVNAQANKAISEITSYLNGKSKEVYAKQYLNIINQFNKKPEAFKLKSVPKIPDGSPIGTTFCDFN